jgi:glycyl-tRNA synthetase
MAKTDNKILQNLISLCKRRGFVFPSSEIYGGFSAIYDYGHYGILLKNNIRDSWWKSMIQLRSDVIGLDSAIFMHPKTWIASGHVDGFNDPEVDCKNCKERFRADHLLEKFGISADKATLEFLNGELSKLKKAGKLKCPNCGSTDLTEARVFSLMVKSNIGSPIGDLKDEDVVYLRPETCGGIYLDYKNTVNSMHPNIPFGIAQVGKAFRNEIVARQFIFRTREFEQMEMQYFVHPDTMKENYEKWKKIRWDWYLENGIPEKKIRWHQHEKLAHYASEAYDIEYDFNSIGCCEVEGIHARGNWDLSQHSKFSGEDLSYLDGKTNERFVPHILETSVGLNRLMLMFLDFAYTEEKVGDEERIILKLPKHLAPVKVAVFPLLKNKPELVSKAQSIYEQLKPNFMCEFDDNGNIGKRYRRQDEIGTPYCITVDFDTNKDETVTVRERDTMNQERIKISDLNQYFLSKLRK